ncbi:MAG: glycosyltransferase, partial [Bacteroidetes bacterium]|nr:glycosyltransferase [Bacteroidota bacterium]
ILFITTVAPSFFPDSESSSKDLEYIAKAFESEIIYLRPQRNYFYQKIPAYFLGYPQYCTIKKKLEEATFIHLFSPALVSINILKPYLHKTFISITGTLQNLPKLDIKYFSKVKKITLQTQNNLDLLKNVNALNNLSLLPIGSYFNFSATLPLAKIPSKDFKIIVVSSPWSYADFDKKGFFTLVQSLKYLPHTHITFLWRGKDIDKAVDFINKNRLAHRVHIITGYQNIEKVMAQYDICIALSSHGKSIKAYPNSIIEALHLKKPVIVNSTIGIADFIRQKNCGEVIENLNEIELAEAIKKIQLNYLNYSIDMDLKEFLLDNTIQNIAQLYQKNERPSSQSVHNNSKFQSIRNN